MQLFLRKKIIFWHTLKKKIRQDNTVCLWSKRHNKSFSVFIFNPALKSLEATIFKFLKTYIPGKKFSLI